MKTFLIKGINIYQKFFSSFLHQLTGVKNACRFEVSCSEYAKNSISKEGMVRGGYMSIIRILKCQPFYKYSI